MNEDRNKKMNSLLKKIIGNSIYANTQEIQSNFGVITINDIKLASDMSYLDIYVSCIKNSQILCKTLAKFAQEIKESINKEITLRKTPIIRFKYDNEIEFATNLIGKINSLEK